MFRKSPTQTPGSLFARIVDNLPEAKRKTYLDNKEWYNVFHRYITSQVNEERFRPLFSDTMGAPNAPIRLLYGMIVLKEGFGWSDSMLFGECSFDLRVMRALGLNNVDDELPCRASYYNFKKAVYCHAVKTGENLLGEEFRSLTKKHAKLFGVQGKYLRMDSTLIGSNIMKCSRLRLILGVVEVFYKDIKERDLADRIEAADRSRIEEWLKKGVDTLVYEMEEADKGLLLEELGYLLLRLRNLYCKADSDKYRLLLRILREQYNVKEDDSKVVVRAPKEISADSLQSPFDEDAAFRNKHDEKVQGFSVNITETCNDEGLNLITDVDVQKSTTADNDFFQPAIERSAELVGNPGQVNADGAYQSEENRQYAEDNQIDAVFSQMQGKEGKYEFREEGEDVHVTNKETGETQKAYRTSEDKYRIDENGRFRYFSRKDIDRAQYRKTIEAIPQEKKNLRNNVEAVMFQLTFYLRNNKTRYRGLHSTLIWSLGRCVWINLRRIVKFLAVHPDSVGGVCPVMVKNEVKGPIFNKK